MPAIDRTATPTGPTRALAWNRKVTDVMVRDFCRRLRAGEPAGDIAADHDVDITTVHKWTTHVPRTARRGPKCIVDYAHIVHVADQVGVTAAAKRLGVSVRTVERARQVVREAQA
ncbi:hypothetical protein [Methylobacterium soli]|uniref:Uncharacterized protein n=1 Tax=Methylobacterium soli TaxID=553447 RepID=A0A6L3SSI9_9HYPH|nr:hypothetical protein [Methylobacterium soli]KAB1076527.1 hypothetical protein F6X53_22755 [Methylobacterium soli]GJE44834.1 hypothetical protein AEGHOMDF_4025 [Methylobacterium soli]